MSSRDAFEGTDGPVAVARHSLSADLLEYLCSSDQFVCHEEALSKLGFDKCVDYPHVPEHRYWEGYFHGLARTGSIDTIHPRKGHMFSKPAAPLPLSQNGFTHAEHSGSDDAINTVPAIEPGHHGGLDGVEQRSHVEKR